MLFADKRNPSIAHCPTKGRPMLTDIKTEFRRHQQLAEAALAHLDDAAFFRKPDEIVNSLAPSSSNTWRQPAFAVDRFSDHGRRQARPQPRRRISSPLRRVTRTADERLAPRLDRVYSTLDQLTEDDQACIVTIRGERFTVLQALLRSLTHTAYHVGQILYLARLVNPEAKWLTIAPGQSRTWSGKYLPEQDQEKTPKP